MSKVWFITGSSTGFGRVLVEELLAGGDQVVATARKPELLAPLREEYPDLLITPQLDVTSPHQCMNAVDEAVTRFGRIDVLVNNAGYGMFGSIEEVSVEEAKRQFDTNFFGVLNVLHAVLPQLRQQRSGRILNISSIGGFSSFSGTGIYCASKFALEAISESLYHELSPLGIRTTIIEPGGFRTNFLGSNYTVSGREITDYADTAHKVLEFFDDFDGNQQGDPRKAAHAMITVADHEDPPMRLLLGDDAWRGAIGKLETLQKDFETWKSTTLSMNFDTE